MTSARHCTGNKAMLNIDTMNSVFFKPGSAINLLLDVLNACRAAEATGGQNGGYWSNSY